MNTNDEDLLARLRIIATDYEPGSILRATLDEAIAALARQEEGREADWPLFTWSGIAPRKLDALRSQGWAVNGYALYRDGMRGLIDLHGAVHWVGDSPTPTPQSGEWEHPQERRDREAADNFVRTATAVVPLREGRG